MEEGIWGHLCTRGRQQAGGWEVSSHLPSHRFPHDHTLWLCRCTAPLRPMYLNVLPPAAMQQHPQACGKAWGVQRGQGEELRRAWERIGEEERTLQEREARVMGEAVGAAGVRARAQGTPGRGWAQAVEELQRAWAEIGTRLERVETAGRDGERPSERAQGSGGPGSCPPLQPLRQPGIPPEVEREVQEGASRRIRGEAARSEERDREVVEWERMVREEEEVAARGGNRIIPHPEGGYPPPRIRRNGHRPRKGQEGREKKVGMRGGSNAGWRNREQGSQPGRRSPPAPARSQRRRTEVRSPRSRGIMRDILRGRCRGRSRSGVQGR